MGPESNFLKAGMLCLQIEILNTFVRNFAQKGWGCCYTPTLPKSASVKHRKSRRMLRFFLSHSKLGFTAIVFGFGALLMTCRELISKLLSQGIVSSQNAAYVTAIYFQLWREGEVFDLENRSVQTHRARLRKLGIDICKPC